MAIQISQISLPTTAKANNDFAVSQIVIPVNIEFEFILPEANGLKWSTGDDSRIWDELYKNLLNNCYEPKASYSQKVRLNDTSNIGVAYGDATDLLTLYFFKIDGSQLSSIDLSINNGWASAEWNWQTLGYENSDIGYIELRGAESGIRARTECICFSNDDCLVKMTYRNKFNKDQLGNFVGNTYRHIAYIPGKALGIQSEDIEDYIDSDGDLFSTKTTLSPQIELETDIVPMQLVTRISLISMHSDILLEEKAVKREGVLEYEKVDNTDLFSAKQLYRLTGKAVQFNF